jgi:hypothetical protein
MFVEERIYTLHPGKIPAYLKLYEEEGMAIQTRILPAMVGYYSTEIGALNVVVHMWGYEGRRAGQDRHEILARREELGRLLSREEGKTLPEGIGEAGAPATDLQVLRRRVRCASPASWSPSVRPGIGSRSRASRRRGRPHHAVELPDRDPGLEDRAGARLRQLRRVQAGRPRPGCAWALAEIISRAACRKACSTW